MILRLPVIRLVSTPVSVATGYLWPYVQFEWVGTWSPPRGGLNSFWFPASHPVRSQDFFRLLVSDGWSAFGRFLHAVSLQWEGRVPIAIFGVILLTIIALESLAALDLYWTSWIAVILTFKSRC